MAAGLDLFISRGCHACHRVDGVYCFAENGPRLSQVGRRLPPARIRRRILRPQERNARSPMPLSALSSGEVERLVLFLSAQVGVENELGSSAKWSMGSRRPPPRSGDAAGWSTLGSSSHPAHKGSLAIRSGAWLGSESCGSYDCHPREHRGWLRTGHASVFERGISGELSPSRGPYDESCVACHTLGHQPGAENDGFDDRARASGWRFPEKPGRGAWSHLPRRVKERANVQCESCHGPGWFYVGYGDDVCAQCHDHPPQYMIVAQGRKNSMSRAQRSVAGQREGDICGQCHVASGFLASIRGHESASKPRRELEVREQGVTCAACHDPHGNDCRRQLRLCGNVEIPGQTFDAGQGALCIACHTGEANVVRGSLHRPFLPGAGGRSGSGHGEGPGASERAPDAAPHAPQFQLLTGRGGRFLDLPETAGPAPVYPHMNVPDSCVGCHYHRPTRRSAGVVQTSISSMIPLTLPSPS